MSLRICLALKSLLALEALLVTVCLGEASAGDRRRDRPRDGTGLRIAAGVLQAVGQGLGGQNVQPMPFQPGFVQPQPMPSYPGSPPVYQDPSVFQLQLMLEQQRQVAERMRQQQAFEQEMARREYERQQAEYNRQRQINERTRSGAGWGTVAGAAVGGYYGGTTGAGVGAHYGGQVGGAVGNDLIREGINARQQIGGGLSKTWKNAF